MDYSLLVGLHFRNTSAAGHLLPSGARTPIGYFSSFFNILFSNLYFKSHFALLLMHETAMFYILAGDDNDGAPPLSRADMDQLLLDPSRYNGLYFSYQLMLNCINCIELKVQNVNWCS